MSPRRATTKAIIAKGMLNVARFLLSAGASVTSVLFAGVTTGGGVVVDILSELVTMRGGSGIGLVTGTGAA